MASVRARHWVGRLLMWVVLGTMVTGCANATFKGDMSIGSRMGFRPDEPNIDATQDCPSRTRHSADTPWT